MEELGTQVAPPPIVIHQALPGRFYNTSPMARKHALPVTSSHQNPNNNWNPTSWNWDSARFIAKLTQDDGVRAEKRAEVQVQNSHPNAKGDEENLRLMLGGGKRNNGVVNLVEELQPVSRPNKRVRSGSPGGANYPMCQVDNCKEDLTTAKDYHRRHKVCEVHSKATKALVGKQMQRFCQQCSRFHPLPEFDEGKRSCRRRLAGHNRRRRKTQPEDTDPQSLAPGIRDNNVNVNVNCDMDIVNLLAVLARAQGTTDGKSAKFSEISSKDQLMQILSKINSLPLPANLADKLPILKNNTNGSVVNHIPSANHNEMNGNGHEDASYPSTKNLLAVLSLTPQAHSIDHSHPSTEGSDSEKSKSPCVDQFTRVKLQRGADVEYPCVGGAISSTSYHSPGEDIQETTKCPNLPLQLFGSSPEDDMVKKLTPCKNYLSSDSSNPSPMSLPPVVHDLFPMQTSTEIMKHDHVSGDGTTHLKGTISNGCSTSLQLFGGSIRPAENVSIQSSPYQTGYTSSSGSDHSPSSLSSDAQDRTGRIVFKLFDKDPSHLPGSLRTQIYNWLSNSPSEMESYIRPGCIVLSLYLSMPPFAWDQLEENLLSYVKYLIKDIDVGFWGNGRFLVNTDRQMASHKDGKIRVCKSFGAWNAPEMISVSPVAVVGGEETSLLLRGRNLRAPGTQIHCTHADGYNIREVSASQSLDSAYDEIILGCFKIERASSCILGRCFIEVENSFRGTCFPVIVADKTICHELRLLEQEINAAPEVCEAIQTENAQITGGPWSREEVLHFLDELGWLFQRKHNSSLFETPDYRITRFKFLLIFSVEHGFCALVKTLLAILLELNMGREGLATESLEMLLEIHLLNRAVKIKSRSMVDLLINYHITNPTDSSKKFIFGPNLAGPGGLTPLHLAACTASSDDLVDALTSDPQELGLQCWNSVFDSSGFSPHAYASTRNNHSYNALVSQKLADRKNGQISFSIENEIDQFQSEVYKDKKPVSQIYKRQKSCSKCAVVASSGYSKKFPGSQGLLRRPYVHSMLVVAAVCVCVCLFLRGHPYVGCDSPFAWENLDYGAI